MTKLELIKIIKELAYKGKDFDFIISEIQKYKDDFDEVTFENAERKIDEFIVNYQLAQLEKSKALNYIIIGIVLFILGSAITIFTYFHLKSQFILAYGAIIAGIGLFIHGFKIYNKNIEDLVVHHSSIKRNPFGRNK